LTKTQYAAALNKLCTEANDAVAPLKLTTDLKVWKKNGDQAAEITQDTVAGFEALTPPDTLRGAAERHIEASKGLATSVQDAADAAKDGDFGKFSKAITQQLHFGILSRTAASELGATECT
jgi:hypothetical protein